MGYEVSTTEGNIVITGTAFGLRVKVSEKTGKILPVNKAYCLATVYRVNGGFIPDKVLLFEALNDMDLVAVKEAVDHYCRVFLHTELYVKEVPSGSLLFKQEALRLYGKKEEEMNGTVSIISNSRTK